MKKTDLEKRLTKKIEGRQKTQTVPQRFAKGSTAPSSSKPAAPGCDAARPAVAAAAAPAAGKPVTLSVRLPTALAQRLRARAVGRAGGISALVAEAVDRWLASSDSPSKKS